MMAGSFHNKILRVNLTTGAISVDEPGALYFRRNLGGWNMILEVLLKEVPKGADPLGPQNKLVFAPGVLTGLAVSGVDRNAVGAKSPLTGGFGAAEVGGFWGSELKQAGFDGIIIEGVSPKPVYLWIKDGVAELRDASAYWGKTTKETWVGLQEELGERRLRAAMIGPGGENLALYATVMNGLYDAAGRTGLGAVMGSKRLKAVAVRGSQRLEGANPDKIRELARAMAQGVAAGEKAAGMHKWGTGASLADAHLTGNLPIRNFRDGDFPQAVDLGSEVFMPQIGTGMEGCFACAVRCKKQVKYEGRYAIDPDYGGPEYETIGALGSACGVEEIKAVCKGSELCNALGLDTIGAGVAIAFAMECFENGLLTLEDTGGIDLRFGNGDAMIAMIEQIALRQGLGDMLANGLDYAVSKIGPKSAHFAIQVKNQPYPMHEPRFKRALAIAYAVSPTGADHCHALHDSGMINADENGFQPNGALRAMGILEPLPVEDIGPNKVRATLYSQQQLVAMNCMPMCMFVPWSQQEKTDLLQAATGWDISAYEMIKVGERALTLARIYNLREGLTAADDRLAERSYGPTSGGVLAEGGIDREELHEAMQTYYVMSGWDRETGAPMPERLDELGIAWAKEYLPK
jgi:aldehyde:ferredoxin oxidoreductase